MVAFIYGTMVVWYTYSSTTGVVFEIMFYHGRVRTRVQYPNGTMVLEYHGTTRVLRMAYSVPCGTNGTNNGTLGTTTK